MAQTLDVCRGLCGAHGYVKERIARLVLPPVATDTALDTGRHYCYCY
jgi:hypothetical protein